MCGKKGEKCSDSCAMVMFLKVYVDCVRYTASRALGEAAAVANCCNNDYDYGKNCKTRLRFLGYIFVFVLFVVRDVIVQATRTKQ